MNTVIPLSSVINGNVNINKYNADGDIPLCFGLISSQYIQKWCHLFISDILHDHITN